MSMLRRVFARAPASTQRPFMAKVITIGITCVAAYSSWALVAHHWITCAPSQGPSMYPSMPSSLSYNIYSRRHKRGKDIKVGDVIVFESPIFLRGVACKRVIGMPGDYVLRDPPLSPTVGGAPIPGLYGGDAVREEPVMIQVPEGHQRFSILWPGAHGFDYGQDSICWRRIFQLDIFPQTAITTSCRLWR
ncbi:hypothetical protein CLAIMM_03476 isoform 3 [Cladophialophora immunda]|nr:hypothetical protein CLAIMM_03476 isoform 3 [Cladophialophora immunda]